MRVSDYRLMGVATAIALGWSGITLAQVPRINPSRDVAGVPAGVEVSPAVSAPTVNVPDGEDYQLGVADKIRIIVFNEPTLSGEFVVGANGMLSFPLVGDIQATGLTSSQVARAIEAKLRDGYVLNPSVSIDVLTLRPFYILGEVNKPGEYPYSSGLTVDAAVAMAQGYTYRADKRRAIILHKGDARAAKVELTPDLRVAPGDTIRIGERHW